MRIVLLESSDGHKQSQSQDSPTDIRELTRAADARRRAEWHDLKQIPLDKIQLREAKIIFQYREFFAEDTRHTKLYYDRLMKIAIHYLDEEFLRVLLKEACSSKGLLRGWPLYVSDCTRSIYLEPVATGETSFSLIIHVTGYALTQGGIHLSPKNRWINPSPIQRITNLLLEQAEQVRDHYSHSSFEHSQSGRYLWCDDSKSFNPSGE